MPENMVCLFNAALELLQTDIIIGCYRLRGIHRCTQLPGFSTISQLGHPETCIAYLLLLLYASIIQTRYRPLANKPHLARKRRHILNLCYTSVSPLMTCAARPRAPRTLMCCFPIHSRAYFSASSSVLLMRRYRHCGFFSILRRIGVWPGLK